MVTLIYGLTTRELTGTDKIALKRFTGKAIKNIYNITDYTNTDDWLIIEANILNPTDMTTINDISLFLKCKDKNINPLCTTIIQGDTDFINTLTLTCLKWGTNLTKIQSLNKKKQRKHLIIQARKYRIEKYKNQDVTKSIQKMGSNLEGTAYERLDLQTTNARTLMQARSILHFHHDKCNIICPYCTLNKHHTITHVITECEYHLTKDIRNTFNTKSTINLNTLTIHHITSILGGPLLPEWTKSTRNDLTKVCLQILRTSPLLFPCKRVFST